MDEFYITFGAQYGKAEEHPQGMHGDGYAVVVAEDLPAARRLGFEVFGQRWAFLYADRPSPEMFPRGEIARIIEGHEWIDTDGVHHPLEMAQ